MELYDSRSKRVLADLRNGKGCRTTDPVTGHSDSEIIGLVLPVANLSFYRERTDTNIETIGGNEPTLRRPFKMITDSKGL